MQAHACPLEKKEKKKKHDACTHTHTHKFKNFLFYIQKQPWLSLMFFGVGYGSSTC